MNKLLAHTQHSRANNVYHHPPFDTIRPTTLHEHRIGRIEITQTGLFVIEKPTRSLRRRLQPTCAPEQRREGT